MKLYSNLFFIYLLPFYVASVVVGQPFATAQVVDPLELFALDGKRNIMIEENFGIINGKITTRVHHGDIGTISGLFAPPYASSNFLLETRLFGEKVPTSDYRWYPFEVQREGEINGISVKTTTVLPHGDRAALIRMTFGNQSGKDILMPIQFHIQGGLDYVERWEFSRPKAESKTTNLSEANRLVRSNAAGNIVIATDIPGLDWFELGSRWDTKVTVPAGTDVTFHIAMEIGGPEITGEAISAILQNPPMVIRQANAAHTQQVEDMFGKLPRFSASDKRLEDYYYRSLVTLLTNKWEVPEFLLQPYYGSGGVIGGCVGNYLWEFGLPAQIFPLYDPLASASHIKQFLKVDMTKHYLFEPMTGEGGGVWYQVNQDKIVELIYYYILHTGDVGFLDEVVEGRPIYDHMLQNALFGDDLSKKINLVDYGHDGENHLELRRGYPYRGVMPDVNALRYLTYIRAYELTKLAGKPMKQLFARAEELKDLLKRELWSEKDQWFFFRYDGKKDIRYTNFMYTLIGTGVFDEEVERGLLSHLNEKEFLGDYGIHSISKLDPAYDQVDIDHGGGGSYVAFPPLICQRLYNAGFADAANDLLERHLWWGERLPYWGDSKVANYMGYREDTPLQSDFDACTGAQTFIFGLFGVSVGLDGTITVNPTVPSFSPEIRLEGLKIRGKELAIDANANGYTVTVDGKPYTEALGIPITF
ncbi:MAG TPA: hypothetical protein VNQ80_02775 [Parapedobacter sp.]|uniref:hypothetical protein n=1 Tax=Parapedobacter sp. TaxID=1958893 RepID=UPI002C71E6A1|nr:hypothetical protein [Parapedobacter sp.]HWK56233.1 hypothetical protein [Parapedobacter sp.]